MAKDTRPESADRPVSPTSQPADHTARSKADAAADLSVRARPEIHDRAQYETYKIELRQQMEAPHVSDPNLARVRDSIYKEGAIVASGSTAAAHRHEIATGNPTFDRAGRETWHDQASEDRSRALEKWLDKNRSTASPGDIAAAENMWLDHQEALDHRRDE